MWMGELYSLFLLIWLGHLLVRDRGWSGFALWHVWVCRTICDSSICMFVVILLHVRLVIIHCSILLSFWYSTSTKNKIYDFSVEKGSDFFPKKKKHFGIPKCLFGVQKSVSLFWNSKVYLLQSVYLKWRQSVYLYRLWSKVRNSKVFIFEWSRIYFGVAVYLFYRFGAKSV